MKLIQPILLAGFLTALFIYLRYLRSSLRDRLVVMVTFLVVSAAVIDPDLTQQIARRVGVGRGTDLTLYLFVLASVFFAVLTYSTINRLHRALTEAVRRIAIVEAEAAQRETKPVSAPADDPISRSSPRSSPARVS